MAEQFIGYIHFATPKAILFQDHFWTAPEWFPKSQSDVKHGKTEFDEVVVVASQWICRQKGVREFEEMDNAEKDA